jgi:hypothetical protein
MEAREKHLGVFLGFRLSNIRYDFMAGAGDTGTRATALTFRQEAARAVVNPPLARAPSDKQVRVHRILNGLGLVIAIPCLMLAAGLSLFSPDPAYSYGVAAVWAILGAAIYGVLAGIGWALAGLHRRQRVRRDRKKNSRFTGTRSSDGC